MKRTLLTLLVALAVVGSGFFGAAPRHAAAQSGTVWQAQFFNNNTLSGGPAYSTQTQDIQFNWGTGSPDPSIQPDSFSARFTTDVYVDAGTYEFVIRADDGVRLFIDRAPTPTIDTFGQAQSGRTLRASVTLAAGVHNLRVDYQELTQDAYLFVNWSRLADSPTDFGTGYEMGTWTTQYFSNQSLAGDAVVVRAENSPSHNWGAGAPVAGVPADFWSARWMGTFSLSGTYGVTVRADDGVRFFVDGNTIVDQWHGATNDTYTAQFTVGAGQHTLGIEYYEATAGAFLNIDFTSVNGSVLPGAVPQPTATTAPNVPTAVPGGPSATVLAWRLNVRDAPSATGTNVIAKINRGETYAIIGRNQAGDWLLLNVNGLSGWVSIRYVGLNNEQPLPIVGAQPAPTPAPAQPQPTGYTLTSRANLNVRGGPSTQDSIVGALGYGEEAPIVGRNADNTWWQILDNGQLGWVIDFYVVIEDGVDINRIPVTG